MARPFCGRFTRTRSTFYKRRVWTILFRPKSRRIYFLPKTFVNLSLYNERDLGRYKRLPQQSFGERKINTKRFRHFRNDDRPFRNVRRNYLKKKNFSEFFFWMGENWVLRVVRIVIRTSSRFRVMTGVTPRFSRRISERSTSSINTGRWIDLIRRTGGITYGIKRRIVGRRNTVRKRPRRKLSYSFPASFAIIAAPLRRYAFVRAHVSRVRRQANYNDYYYNKDVVSDTGFTAFPSAPFARPLFRRTPNVRTRART